MHRLRRPFRTALVALAGVLAAFGLAGLTQVASGQDDATATTETSTTSTTKTKTTTTTTAKPKAKATTRTLTCKAKLVASKPPVSNAENFGTFNCSAPLGKGVQHDTATVTRSGDAAGSFSGPIKHFFNTGTIIGTYKLGFTVAGQTVTYKGTSKITSATGALAGVTGKGTITGSSTDGIHSTLRTKLTLTFPPAKSP